MQLIVVVMYREHPDEQFVVLNLQQLLFYQHPIRKSMKINLNKIRNFPLLVHRLKPDYFSFFVIKLEYIDEFPDLDQLPDLIFLLLHRQLNHDRIFPRLDMSTKKPTDQIN